MTSDETDYNDISAIERRPITILKSTILKNRKMKIWYININFFKNIYPIITPKKNNKNQIRLVETGINQTNPVNIKYFTKYKPKPK